MAYKPNMEDIKKLRAITGAGLADVKKALTEAEGDFDKAKDLLRERGLAIAAKRSDRETSNGCVLVKVADDFAAGDGSSGSGYDRRAVRRFLDDNRFGVAVRRNESAFFVFKTRSERANRFFRAWNDEFA